MPMKFFRFCLVMAVISLFDCSSLRLAKNSTPRRIPAVKTLTLNITQEIESKSPAAGDSLVPANTQIRVIFKRQGLDMITNGDSVFIVRDGKWNMVAGEVFLGTSMVTFTPVKPFILGENYRVTFQHVQGGNIIMSGADSWAFKIAPDKTK
jgi:Bacterial Ig-like domain